MTAAVDLLVLEVPRIKLDQIRTHPLNPRRDATADEEMVDSIRQQGVLEAVMVAPAVDGDGWILIDGHRRFDGAARAGLSDVPANPRYDLVTEAQQVEVMVITGLQKELLSPVEEAAGYEQLTLLGFDVAAIATSLGFSQARVKSRMKLNTLGEGVRDSLHGGQLTLTDAEAFLEFAGDPVATAELEAAVGTPNFRHQVHTIRGRVERTAEREARAAELTAAGARQVISVAGAPGLYRFSDDDDFAEFRAVTLNAFAIGADTREPDAHAKAGCLGFGVPEYEYSDVYVVCTQPDTHQSAAAAERAADNTAQTSEWEKQQEARAEEAALQKAAGRARLEWLGGHFAGMFPTKSHQTLAAATKALLPLMIVDGRDMVDVEFLTVALGVEPAGEQDTFQAHSEAATAYATGMVNLTATKALTGLSGWLAGAVADQLNYEATWGDYDDVLLHLGLWDWMTAAGYQMSDTDVATRARLESRLLELTSEDDEGGGDE